MATHGSLAPFDSSTEDWTSYTQRMNYYFVANDVADGAKKRSILLSACGATTYKIIRNLVEEDKLDTTSYDDIVKLVKAHFDPTPSAIMQRYKFNTRTREEGESVAAYVAALRDIAQHCEYKENLQDMLRDRLVCGVRHKGITNRLLAEKKLDYDKALELAKAIESAETNTKQLQSTPPTATGTPQTQPATQSTASAPQVNRTMHPKKGRGQRKQNPKQSSTQMPCYRCGGDGHSPAQCRFKDAVCHACKKRGHIVRACRSKLKMPKKTHHLQEEHTDSEEDDGAYTLFTVRSLASQPLVGKVTINGVAVQMELDTGAAYSVITQTTYQRIAQQKSINSLEPSDLRLRSYSGDNIQVYGQVPVVARYGQQERELYVQVVAGNGPDLMGRDWLSELKVTLKVGEVNTVEGGNSLQTVLERHSAVFEKGLGCLKGMTAKLNVDNNATPKFYKARTVPLALKEKVEAELDNLESMGIISPIQFSRWAAPVVPVIKQNGGVRLCGDYKLTVNQASPVDSYPLPRVDELLASLSGGKLFSKLDLSQAYLQLPLDEQSQEYVTVNTHKGLYRYNRLPFGVSSAPSIFQRTMDNLMRGIKGVSTYIDDILISGSTIDEHLQTLDVVLQKLETAGLKLNKSKCFFLHSQVEYLGHIIDKVGLHPTAEKVLAIREAPRPHNVSELRSFFGIINYYNRFLPNLSTKLAPLYRLLQKSVPWTWGNSENQAFEAAKRALQDNSLLVHFDEKKPLVLACDASQYGLGAVLSHVMEDGQERPIAYASRTLSPAEKNYAQIEKEGLAIIFGVKKFHYYLYGRPFVIESDHQPLSYLFNEKKGISQTASSRIQRWALTLSAYQYTIRHKAGISLSNADALSRLPRPVTTHSDRVPGDLLHLFNHLSATTVSARAIKEWTNKDPTLSKVRRYVMTGWPSTASDEFKPYQSRAKELSVQDGCVLWGSRVVIPPQGRLAVLEELHETHPGATKMKALARSYVWWPKMDCEIETVVKQCPVCQESRASPPLAPLHPWQWPSQLWSRVHLDFAGPYMGHMFLVIVDAHSKWLDAHIMSAITSLKTIEVLRSVFAIYGLPQTIVTDNGPSFTSEEFAQFMARNGIKHVKSAPYHPSSNGQAERAVQTLKLGIKRTKGGSIQERLSKFLFDYRITPHTTTGIAPCELLMKRKLRSRFDLLYPEIGERVEKRQLKQSESHDRKKELRKFTKDEEVYVENFTKKNPRWIPGIITEVTGPLSYEIQLQDGTKVKRHIDHVRKREVQSSPEPVTGTEVSDTLLGPTLAPEVNTPAVGGNSPPPEADPSAVNLPRRPPVVPPSVNQPNPTLRRSTRSRPPPARYGQNEI